MKKIFTILGILFAFNMHVNAASLCSYQEQTELTQKASNVTASYEIKKEEVPTEEESFKLEIDHFEVAILNVTDEFYVKVKNNVTDEEMRFTSGNAKNGIITFRWDYLEDVTNFTIEVYTTNQTNCPDEVYKTVYVTTPKYNEYYNREVCQRLSEFSLCQKYVTFSEISEERFLNQIREYENGNIDENGEKNTENQNFTILDHVLNFINTYKWYLVGTVIVIIGIVIVTRTVNKKKQRDLR